MNSHGFAAWRAFLRPGPGGLDLHSPEYVP